MMHTKLRIYIFALSIALLISLSSCITPRGMTSSSTPLQGKKIAENLGKAKGCYGSISILSLYSIGRPDIDEAIIDAVNSKGGDALINVRMYEKTWFFLLVTYSEVIVEGEVIKFEDQSPKSE